MKQTRPLTVTRHTTGARRIAGFALMSALMLGPNLSSSSPSSSSVLASHDTRQNTYKTGTQAIQTAPIMHLRLSGNALAQSGGGFGGRSSGSSGRSSSRSSGSSRSYGGSSYGGSSYNRSRSSRSSRSYGGSYGSNYGYSSGYRSYNKRGMSSLELMLFGLIIGAVLLTMFASARRSRAFSGASGGTGQAGFMSGFSGTAQAVSIQILMMRGDEVKTALQDVARRGNPDTNDGLTRMLQEAALVALRHPERWVYADVERAQGNSEAADRQVGAWATQARAAFSKQTTSHYQDQDANKSSFEQEQYEFKTQGGELYLAVTIAVAAYTLHGLPPAGVTTMSEVRAALSSIGSMAPDDLLRGEVIWSPDVEGEFLTEDQALMKYPDLTKI